MTNKLSLIEIPVPANHKEAFMDGLEELSDSMSCFEEEETKKWTILIYTQNKPDKSIIETALKNISDLCDIEQPLFNISEVEETDWVAESQNNFEPVIAGKLFIHASWRTEEIPQDHIEIEIDPQRAFGTGTHETTKGSLIAIQKLKESNDFINILDMGCGSGILAIATAKLWPFANIIAVDNDPVCVETSITNASINNVKDILKIEGSDGYKSKLVKQNAPYDLIVSNILAKPLIELAPFAKKSLKTGGYLILAGLLAEQADEVIEAHESLEMTLIDRLDINNWSILTLSLMNRAS